MRKDGKSREKLGKSSEMIRHDEKVYGFAVHCGRYAEDVMAATSWLCQMLQPKISIACGQTSIAKRLNRLTM
jgi:hypothetical protein